MAKTVKEVVSGHGKPKKSKVRVNVNGKYSHFFKLEQKEGGKHGKKR